MSYDAFSNLLRGYSKAKEDEQTDLNALQAQEPGEVIPEPKDVVDLFNQSPNNVDIADMEQPGIAGGSQGSNPLQSGTFAARSPAQISEEQPEIPTTKDPVSDYANLLKVAKERRDKLDLSHALGKAAEDIGRGGTVMKGGQANQVAPSGALEVMKKVGQQGVQDVEDQQKLDSAVIKQREDVQRARLAEQANDPNSDYSKSIREQLYNINPAYRNNPVFQRASAKMIEQLYPMINAQENREARLAQQQENREAKNEANRNKMDSKLSEKDTKQRIRDEKIFSDYAKTVAQVQGRTGTIGIVGRKVATAENGLRLIDAVLSGQVVPNTQVSHELATALAATFSGTGNATVYATHGFEPKTAGYDFGKFVEYFTSNPSKVLNKTYLNQYRKTLETERDFWKSDFDNKMGQYSSSLAPVFRRKNKDGSLLNEDLFNDYNRLLNQAGINTSPYRDLSDYKQSKSDTAIYKAAESSGMTKPTNEERKLIESGGVSSEAKPSGSSNEVRRKTKDGRIVVYDATTKKPLRYE